MKKFSQEYINKGDAKKAAVEAGVPTKSAAKIGADWLALPHVQRYINEEIDKSAEKAKVTRDWVMDEAVKILRNTVRPDIKIQALALLDKLLSKKEGEGGDDRAPQIHIHSDGGLTIL